MVKERSILCKHLVLQYYLLVSMNKAAVTLSGKKSWPHAGGETAQPEIGENSNKTAIMLIINN